MPLDRDSDTLRPDANEIAFRAMLSQSFHDRDDPLNLDMDLIPTELLQPLVVG
jgi:hypothetical protein